MTDVTTTDEIRIQRAQSRKDAIFRELDELAETLTYRIDCALDGLIHQGAFPYRDFHASAARTALCKRLADETVRALLRDDLCDVPDEVRYCWKAERR